MSDILIKGMEMPTEGTIIAVYKIDGKLYATRGLSGKLYPLVPVPSHGRLIDANELHSVLRKRAKEFSNSEYGEGVKCGLADAREYIKIAPTIIPADQREVKWREWNTFQGAAIPEDKESET